jgi:para-nitrobenzyl esterase
VATAAGRVRGQWRGDSAAFLGIPFAEPPVGELRFAAPVPHRGWSGVRDATQYGATAQRKSLAEVTLIPEPCVAGDSTLNVDVFTPSPGDTDAALPVLVWIHGGGFIAGSPASPWYDGSAFNRDGVVTVSISYRLGFDGFGWIEDAPHNRGVLDWKLALEWVQTNIAAFGGDPSRVTIAGQSAGGGAVLTLLGMPAAQGLFSAAWSVSGATADVPLDRAEYTARRLAALAKVEPTRSGLSTLSEDRILELQAVVSQPSSKSPLPQMRSFIDDGMAFGPVVDGELLPRPTLESLRAGVGADKALVLGATDDEFSMALDSAKRVLRFVPAGWMLGSMGLGRQSRRAYRHSNAEVNKAGTAAIVGRYITDRMFRTLVVKIANARGVAPTWTYRFAWRTPMFGSAVHCLDVPFFFDCLDREHVDRLAGPTPSQDLANEVHGAAVKLIESGNPGWTAWSAHEGSTRLFDAVAGAPTELSDGFREVRSLL